MATAKELDYKPGNVAIWGSALKEVEVGGHKGMLGGIPLNTAGAEVHIGIGRVLEVGTPGKYSDSPTTKIKVLWSNEDDTKAGQEIEIHDGFRNYIHEGDRRLREELAGAGVVIRAVTEPNGEVVYEVNINPAKE